MRHGCQHHKHHHGAAPFTRPGAEKHYPPDLRVEPVHMHLDLFVNVNGATLEGRNTLTLRGRGGTGDALELHAVGFDHIEVIEAELVPEWDTPPSVPRIEPPSDEDAPPKVRPASSLRWRYDGETLHVRFAEPLADGEERRIAIDYRVVKPASGLFFSKPTDTQPDAAWYAATDNETERARHWMPCVDLPSVRPTLSFAIRARDRFTILANGASEGEVEHGDGTKTARWRLEQPCPSYITCFAVGDFVEHRDGSFGDIPIAYYTTKEFTAEHLERSFGRTRQMLEWMTAKLGVPFPYPKYYQFALPGFGGAMENISLVSWDDIFVMDASLATEWTRLVDQVNVHEMAHSYFGDLVVCRDFAHAWLKESWATYMEVCWFEDMLGRDEGDYEFYGCAGAYFHEADHRYVRPVVTREYNSSWQMYDAHLYPGGACRLHTLRHLVGDDAFWTGVRNYLQRHAEKTVETDHFRHAIEEASGRSLGAFFDQWIHGKGYPNLEVSFERKAESELGVFTIKQTQMNPDTGVGLFDFELEVGWIVGDDDQGRTLHTRTVRVDQATNTFSFLMPEDPEQVRIDPRNRVLARYTFNPGDDKLKAQLASSPDVIGRIRATAELVMTGKRVNIEAVRKAYDHEPFWGVRLEMIREVAHAKSEAAIEALVHMLTREGDPKVLEKAFQAAGAVRDARVQAIVEERLERGLPHRAKKAAYEALGAQRARAPLDTLMDASRRTTFGGLAQSGALMALGRTRSKAVLERLLDATRPDATHARARPAALTALGTLGTVLAKGTPERVAAVDRLSDLLRDPVDRVRMAAARALATMEADEAIGDMILYARTLSRQEEVVVMRLVDGIREAVRARPDGKDDSVVDLQNKVRKLEDALEKLQARFDAHVGLNDPAPKPADDATSDESEQVAAEGAESSAADDSPGSDTETPGEGEENA